MANSLINGPEVAGDQPATQPPADVVPTWGYKGDKAQLFDLKPGEKLPKGWSDTPTVSAPEPEPEPPTNDDPA
jgi:hypothetical protein